jgi:hypothetical protein
MATEINVDSAQIRAVMLAGEWVRVTDVIVSFAAFTVTDAAGVRTTHARGPHLSARVVGGPHSGERLVAALAQIEAVTVA